MRDALTIDPDDWKDGLRPQRRLRAEGQFEGPGKLGGEAIEQSVVSQI
jgi:hypothetical protein